MTARRTLPLMAALAVATALGTAPMASAAPEPTSWQRMLDQQPLVHAADVIQGAVSGFAGFAGIVLEDDHVSLWWKGAVPAEVTAAVAKAESQAPVEIEHARYSNAELRAAADVIESRLGEKSPVHAVKIPANGSGLVLGAYPWSDATAFTAAAARGRAGAHRRRGAAAAGVAAQRQPAMEGRRDDRARQRRVHVGLLRPQRRQRPVPAHRRALRQPRPAGDRPDRRVHRHGQRRALRPRHHADPQDAAQHRHDVPRMAALSPSMTSYAGLRGSRYTWPLRRR
jgi:hypothetical protein